MLDAELARVYDVIGQKRGGNILYSPYRQLLRELMRTLIEHVGVHRARRERAEDCGRCVLGACVRDGRRGSCAFVSGSSKSAANTSVLQQTYSLLKGEVDHARALTLEVLVVLLILFEILMALFRVAH